MLHVLSISSFLIYQCQIEEKNTNNEALLYVNILAMMFINSGYLVKYMPYYGMSDIKSTEFSLTSKALVPDYQEFLICEYHLPKPYMFHLLGESTISHRCGALL
jgi:hypothetical protein